MTIIFYIYRCYAFIDGVFRYCCRPKENFLQRMLYNGYYGGHGFKYHAVVAPNGISIDFYGPETGRHNDNFLLNMSGIKSIFPELPIHKDSNLPFYIYGDSAYSGRTPYLKKADTSPFISIEQVVWNKKHNSVRTFVEHYFRSINETFDVLKMKDMEKPFLSPVGIRYLVSVVLVNCKNCLLGGSNPSGLGNRISKAFQCKPPTIDEYLSIPVEPRRPFTL